MKMCYVNFPEIDFYSLFIHVAEKKDWERKIFVAYFCNPVNFRFDVMMKHKHQIHTYSWRCTGYYLCDVLTYFNQGLKIQASGL